MKSTINMRPSGGCVTAVYGHASFAGLPANSIGEEPGHGFGLRYVDRVESRDLDDGGARPG
jgi:hypothetical protein